MAHNSSTWNKRRSSGQKIWRSISPTTKTTHSKNKQKSCCGLMMEHNSVVFNAARDGKLRRLKVTRRRKNLILFLWFRLSEFLPFSRIQYRGIPVTPNVHLYNRKIYNKSSCPRLESRFEFSTIITGFWGKHCPSKCIEQRGRWYACIM